MKKLFFTLSAEIAVLAAGAYMAVTIVQITLSIAKW